MEQASTQANNPSAQAGNQTAHESRCFELLHTVIDGEATPEEVDYFNKYSRDCLPVYRMYQLDVAIKQIIAHRIEKKRAPLGLVDSIKSRILENRV